jgi:bacteriocin-like protein
MNCLRNEYPTCQKSISPSLFGKPTKRSIRAAVKQMILAVQASHGLSDEELAEIIGGCKETVANWRDEAATMNTEALLVFAYSFGEDAIAPLRQLYLCAPTSEETVPEKRRRLIRELQSLEADE